MQNKIRAHKLVTIYLKNLDLEYTTKDIMANIEKYGVLIDSVVVKNRLEWVLDSAEVELVGWPENKKGSFEKVKILSDYRDYLVVFKPVNVVVEDGSRHHKDNLMFWLGQNYSQLPGSKFNQPESQFYPVHRLDKNTQGILLIAKNLHTQEFFQNQFRERTVIKKYLATVDNIVDKVWITTHYQSRNPGNPLKQKLFWDHELATKFDENSRIALTEIKPILYCQDNHQTLIEVTLKTGRMHQIRLLCEELGFPITGEELYNTNINPPKKINSMAVNITSKIPQMEQIKFDEIIKNIFEDGNCLISNYLEFTEPYKNNKEFYQIFYTTALK